jgi:hypothetical protein
MTRRTTATVAGVTFLVYIVFAMTAMFLSRTGGAEGTAARLGAIAAHATQMRVSIVLELLCNYCALVLAVTLYAITRDVDANLALFVLAFRTAEGVFGAAGLPRSVGRLWLATASGPAAPDPASANALSAVLLKLPESGFEIGGSFFAIGSTVFAYLLLRGRLVPRWLAWLGLIGSILVDVLLPLQLVSVVGSPVTDLMWLPLLVFEVTLGFWLIVKGVAEPARRQPA